LDRPSASAVWERPISSAAVESAKKDFIEALRSTVDMANDLGISKVWRLPFGSRR
jgi:hypothetical protein